MTLKKYTKYKPSGVEWIGDIPYHWKTSRLKFLGSSTIGITYSPDQVTTDGGTLVLRSSNIQQSKLSLDDCVYVTTQIPEKCVTKVGDILLCSRNGSADLVGKNILIDKEIAGVTFGAFMTVVRSKIYPYLYWYFNSPLFKSQSGLFSSTTINQLTNDILSNLVVVYPDNEKEQQAIASYLDEKTALIDSAIRKKEKLIELLQEERTAIINRAVTRGLDPNVKLKASGVEWLGDIPEHWEAKKLKFLLSDEKGSLKPGPFGSDLKTTDMQGGEYKVYTQKNVIEGNVLVGEDAVSVEKYEALSAFEVKAGDILVTTRGTIGRSFVLPEGCPKGIIHPCLVRLRHNPALVSAQWLNNYFNMTTYFKEAVMLQSNSTIIDVIYGYTLSEVILPVPPLPEQTSILDLITKKTEKVTGVIDRVKNEVLLLQEYRTALINEVVTGKRCVIPQP